MECSGQSVCESEEQGVGAEGLAEQVFNFYFTVACL